MGDLARARARPAPGPRASAPGRAAPLRPGSGPRAAAEPARAAAARAVRSAGCGPTRRTPAGRGRVRDLGEAGTVDRERLLDEHGLAGAQARRRDPRVLGVRRGDHDRVDVRRGDDLFASRSTRPARRADLRSTSRSRPSVCTPRRARTSSKLASNGRSVPRAKTPAPIRPTRSAPAPRLDRNVAIVRLRSAGPPYSSRTPSARLRRRASRTPARRRRPASGA